MGAFRFDRAWEWLTSMELLVGLLWTGVGVFAVALLVLMRSKLGESRPLRKCVVLSLLVHLLLAGYATTVQIVSGYTGDEPVMHISFVEGPQRKVDGAEDPVAEEKPWERFRLDAAVHAEPVDPARKPPRQPAEPERQVRTEPANLPTRPSLEHLDRPEAEQREEDLRFEISDFRLESGRRVPKSEIPPEGLDAPPPERRDAAPAAIPEPSAAARRPPITESMSPPVRAAYNGDSDLRFQIRRRVPKSEISNLKSEIPPEALAALTDRMSRASAAEPAELTDGHSPAEDTAYAAEKGIDGSTAESQRTTHTAADEAPGTSSAAISEITIGPSVSNKDAEALPEMYKLRVAPDRLQLAEPMGATPATEAAVKAALKWLADNQNPHDGRWDAGDHGAGKERQVVGRDRQSAGIQADTGMTGLALLAFLAAGHTHQQGPYRENVRRGLQYLLSVQSGDGNLGGRATAYAKMYCHAMATFAISEAYGMTGDRRLRTPVLRATSYTLTAQEPTSGGWRYRPGDPGDTSQCGWQLMALKSAELAGIPTPVRNYNGMIRYLRSAGSGQHGGLSAYRPGERVSRPMTAEALVCWQFLGMPRDHPAGKEAGDYLLEELPGQGKVNLYYWYYATLGMYQLQGVHWQRWNEALRDTLPDSQQKTGPLTGSWDPDTVWGGYGGRVYSTAMATLCLEVYYRFLPLYANAAPPENRTE